jgi:hypothetical protein
MGYVCYYRKPGQSDLEHLRQELLDTADAAGHSWTDRDGGRHRQRLLDGATKHSIFYGALEITDPDGHTYTTCLIVLIKRGMDRNGMNFCRKEFTEDQAGGGYPDCPERIYRQLSPVEQCRMGDHGAQIAREFRAAVAERIAADKAKPTVRRGDTVIFDQPLEFVDGGRARGFVCLDGRRNRYRRLSDGRTVRLASRQRWGAYTVRTPAETAKRLLAETLAAAQARNGNGGLRGAVIPADPDRPIHGISIPTQAVLAMLQERVGGCIQPVAVPGRDDISAYLNEDGKHTGLPRNERATQLLAPELRADDWIAGDLVLAGFEPATGETTSLPDPAETETNA